MWPLYPLSNALIGISITSHFVSCSWVQEVGTQYCLNAYTKQPLLAYEVIDVVLYNSSRIRQLIIQFLYQYNVQNAYAIVACESTHTFLPQEIIMQYQLLVLNIPLNCIMITSCDTAKKASENVLTLSASFNNLKKTEVLESIGLYKLGKKYL